MFIKNDQAFYLYYILVLFGLATVLLTTPFLRFPYDAIAHLIAIDEMYHDAAITSTSIPNGRLIWHNIWARIFYIFDITSLDFLLRAKIIHVVQTFVALFSVYYFSHVVIRNIFYNIPKITLQYLSLWSVLIWFSIFATFSMHYQLIWNLWYSISYQITLPLFWYITALTLVLFLEDISIRKKIFFIIQILIISRFILQAHSMEFMYYLMYVFTFSLFYIGKIYQLVKSYYYLFILFAASIVYFIKNFQPDSSQFFNYMNKDQLPFLYDNIISTGERVIGHYNRSSAVINELMYFIFYTGIIVLVYFLWHKYHKKSYVHSKVFIFIIATSLFIFIPLYQFPAGLFGIITKQHVVHRIYYSSSLFVLLPIFIYYISKIYKLRLRYINLLLLISLLSVFTYSKYDSSLGNTYYKNIRSIKNSFSREKYTFHLSQKHIDLIGDKIAYYESKNPTTKEIHYFARHDIAFVLKYVYGKKVYWKGRRWATNHKKAYWRHKKYIKYHNVMYIPHRIFPPYTPYK